MRHSTAIYHLEDGPQNMRHDRYKQDNSWRQQPSRGTQTVSQSPFCILGEPLPHPAQASWLGLNFAIQWASLPLLFLTWNLFRFRLLIWMMNFVAPPELQPVSLYLWIAVNSSLYCMVGFFILFLTFLSVLTTNPNTLLTTMCVHFNAKYFVYISFNLHNNSLRLGTTLFPFYK